MDLGEEMTWHSQCIISCGTWPWQALKLVVLTLITGLVWHLPGFSPIKLLFFPFMNNKCFGGDSLRLCGYLPSLNFHPLIAEFSGGPPLQQLLLWCSNGGFLFLSFASTFNYLKFFCNGELSLFSHLYSQHFKKIPVWSQEETFNPVDFGKGRPGLSEWTSKLILPSWKKNISQIIIL